MAEKRFMIFDENGKPKRGTTNEEAFSNVDNTSDATKDAAIATLTNKSLTSPVLTGIISGDAFLDEDNMVSDSATKLASQQSIKKYVDDNAGGGLTLDNSALGSNNRVVLEDYAPGMTGGQSVILGVNAGNSLTTGSSNTMIGYDSGTDCLIGSQNTFVGDSAGANTTGSRNTHIGQNAGVNTTTANDQVIIGSGAGGTGVATQSGAICIGRNAECNGPRSIGIGAESQVDDDCVTIGNLGGLSATGAKCVSIGSNARRSGGTGVDNVGIGFDAGRSQTGSRNSFIGTRAGNAVSSGSDNVAIGWESGNLNTGGTNVLLGQGAGKSGTGSGNVVIGNSAGNGMGAIANALIIENSSDITTPLIRGNFNTGSTGDIEISGGLKVTTVTDALTVPRLTTTEKNALTPVNGMLLYDVTLNKFQGYENGAWASLI